METHLRSLRDAARILGVSEESLRRRILTGELDATPVDDDRQYLIAVREPEPPPRRSLSFVRVGFTLMLIVVIGAIFSSAAGQNRSSLCVQCAQVRHEVGLRARFSPADRLTAAIRSAYPDACRHRWVNLFHSSGRSLRLLSQNLERCGIVESARKVDPKGAADLVRWSLGRDWGVQMFDEKVRFETAAEFQAWFARLRARVTPPEPASPRARP